MQPKRAKTSAKQIDVRPGHCLIDTSWSLLDRYNPGHMQEKRAEKEAKKEEERATNQKNKEQEACAHMPTYCWLMIFCRTRAWVRMASLRT